MRGENGNAPLVIAYLSFDFHIHGEILGSRLELLCKSDLSCIEMLVNFEDFIKLLCVSLVGCGFPIERAAFGLEEELHGVGAARGIVC